MFFGATAFNQSLANWKYRKGTHFDGMFDGASSFSGTIPEFFELVPTRAVLEDLLTKYATESEWSSSAEALKYGYVQISDS